MLKWRSAIAGKYKLGRQAKRDLQEIHEFTAERWNMDQAASYLMKLHARLEQVADNPDIGQNRDDASPGYYSVLVGSHIIFYRKRKDYIAVARVLHQSMDYTHHLS